MKPDCSAESWLKFFTSAGIPMESSRTYAVTFSKNEIHLDMLSEIKKEYLVDMGITLMGHIIAILRHAKTVYEENITKTTLSSAPQKGSTSIKVVPKEKPLIKPIPVKATLETEISSVAKSAISAEDTRQQVDGTYNSMMYGPHLKSPNIRTAEKDSSTIKKNKESETILKSKMSSVIANDVKKKPSIVETPAKQNDDVSTTTKGKVFERLGDEVLSENPSSSPESSTSSSESVFTRLGEKTSYSSTSPAYNPDSPSNIVFSHSNVNTVESSTDIFGARRGSLVQNGKKPKKKTVLCTMRADEAEAQYAALSQRGRKRSRTPSPDVNTIGHHDIERLRRNIKSRLGRMSRSVSPSRRVRASAADIESEKIAFHHAEMRSDIKSRLGLSNFERSEERNSVQGKGSILAKRPNTGDNCTESIGLSSLTKISSGIKSRLGQANSNSKSSQNPKKVSFGPVSQQYIPLETKQMNRPFRNARLRFEDNYYSNFNNNFGLKSGSRFFNNRLGY